MKTKTIIFICWVAFSRSKTSTKRLDLREKILRKREKVRK